VPVVLADELHDSLPLAVTLDHKPFSLGAIHDGRAILIVQLDLDGDERGRFRQHVLREGVYAAHRDAPLREAVVYTSFGGLEYSDGPRAIHEELVRRGAALDHLWMVWDARARVPDGATALRYGSREHFDAVARARFVVTNDILPEWFKRRPDQVCVQTWHGTPLKPVGTDMAAPRPWQRRLNEQAWNWQYVVSPNAFATPILRRAFEFDGEILEVGDPRSDPLAAPDRDALTHALRRRLGVPDGKRVVLYAPTSREHAAGTRGGFRLDLHLDLERLRQAIGEDSVVLFRKHHRVSDVVPTMDGFVYDVSTYPDATELLLAADVLVTDYSSVMFDFANTGRPMLFFAYDLDAYRDDIESYYVDYLETIPGPLVQTTDDVAEALQDVDAVRRDYDARYSAFASEYCALDDGHASARVVDRLFGH
jgi:CDP-glycerol glycerophosphotransferase